MKTKCSKCGEIRTVRFTIYVDGVEHPVCEDCHKKAVAQFKTDLAAGVPRAVKIWQFLTGKKGVSDD